MMRYLYVSITIILLSFFFGCKTHPPTDPNKLSLKTGEIVVKITFQEDQSINSDKTVLLEDFANVSCTPCVTSNKIIRRYTHNIYGPEKLVAVKFPTNFPSPNDPFYLANSASNDYRMNYYNIFFAPTTIIDGTERPVSTDSITVKQAIDNQLSSPTDFEINVTKQTDNNGVVYDVIITAKNLAAYNLNDLFLRFAVVEAEVEFAIPPGSNGETVFYDVMRVMLPSDEGFNLVDINGPTQQQVFNFENTIDTQWNLDLLHAVVYIQNNSSMDVYQAGSSF